jgi:hypothetical protein
VVSCKYCSALLPPDLITLFCPECGATLTNLEKEMARKRNKDRRSQVSIKLQAFFAIIPILTFVASYRVKKFRKCIIIYSIALVAALINGVYILQTLRLIGAEYSGALLSLLSLWLVPSSIMVYFIIKWSRYWNKVFALLQHLE